MVNRKAFWRGAIVACVGLFALAALDPRPLLATSTQSSAPPTSSSREAPPRGYTPAPPTRASALGRALYASLDCAACHKIEGRGGIAGPPLDGVGGRRGAEVIAAQLADPQGLAERHPEAHRWEPA